MPSHFSTIGFYLTTAEELLELARTVGPQSQRIEVENGAYYYWQDTSGAELWLQVNQENELMGITPHFAGKSRVNIGVTNTVSRTDDTPLEGALHGWSDPPPDKIEDGIYPFIFDVPNFGQFKKLEYPCLVTAQIAAFAHEIRLYDSIASYNEIPSDGLRFASQSFVPSGLFLPREDSDEPPQTYGLFTGHIVESEERVNGLSGTRFFWSLVETLGAVFDVVIDPELVPEMPKVGGVLQGTFWLSGKLVLVA